MCRRSGPVAKQASRLRASVEHEHPDQELRSQALRLAMGAVGQLGAADSVGTAARVERPASSGRELALGMVSCSAS